MIAVFKNKHSNNQVTSYLILGSDQIECVIKTDNSEYATHIRRCGDNLQVTKITDDWKKKNKHIMDLIAKKENILPCTREELIELLY